MKFVALMFVICFLSGFIFYGYMHESVHQNIYLDYGIKGKIAINFPDMVMIPEANCPTENCNFANNMNDAIGYHLLPFYFIVGLGLFFIIVLNEICKEINVTLN